MTSSRPSQPQHHRGPETIVNNCSRKKNAFAQREHDQQSLEATYTSLIQEYLQVMCLENATFLAERMVASCKTTNAYYLLGVCHYRSGAPQRALSVLSNNIHQSSRDASAVMSMNEWLIETSPCPIPNGAAGLYLLGNICRRSNRRRRAVEYYRMSLQLDPLMWVSYEALCEMG
eukprot:jgi/Psemu1/184742/e_gw1.41.21.1